MTNNSHISDPKYSTWSLITDLYDLIKPYKWRFFFASLFRLSADIVWLFPAFALATIVNVLATGVNDNSVGQIGLLLFLWVAAVIWRSFAMILAKRLGFEVAERAGLDLTTKTLRHVFLLDMAWQERENAGNKMKRINKGNSGVSRILRMWISRVIEIIVNFVGMPLILAAFEPKIAIFTIIFIVTHFIISHFFMRKAAAAAHLVNVQEESVSGLMFESMNNVRSVKVMSMIHRISTLIQNKINDLYRKIKKRIFWFQIRGESLRLWSEGFRIGIFIFIIFGIIQGRYEIGLAVLFFAYFGRVSMAITELSSSVQEFVIAKLSVMRAQAILNEPITIDNDAGKLKFPADWKRITIDNVSFAYQGKKVLQNVSFTISRGEKIGIVGSSGGGKSTLMKLFMKEYENFSGEINIDGIPVEKIKKTDYFNHVGVVLQETEVFNFSLRENISITNAKERMNGSLLSRSARIAHVSEFANKMPKGMDTLIGEKGIKLSGGEKQRVGIARAVFKKPDILLLDEATSHLDVESEEKIQDSLHKLFQSLTAVVIAHRLSTIKEMDKILVIEGGRIVESGSFDQLYKDKGRFYVLWNKQKL